MSKSDERCRGFIWVGQDFAYCDRCGKDIRDHDGMDLPVKGSALFRPVGELVPFPEAMQRMPLFADCVTPINASGGPYRWEKMDQCLP